MYFSCFAFFREARAEKKQKKNLPKKVKKTKKTNGKKKPVVRMKNITINIPEIYDLRIKDLVDKKVIPSRSEAVRTALREFLHEEYNGNLDLLGFWEVQVA